MLFVSIDILTLNMPMIAFEHDTKRKTNTILSSTTFVNEILLAGKIDPYTTKQFHPKKAFSHLIWANFVLPKYNYAAIGNDVHQMAM